MKFKGFSDSETFARMPDSFFQHLLAGIDDLDELKVTLYALWRLGNMEGSVQYMRTQDFSACVPQAGPALEKAVKRGSLLEAFAPLPGQADRRAGTPLYFLNNPPGRAAAEAYDKGEWQPALPLSDSARPERQNIFRLYEESIGPLTPMIADALKDAGQTYPPDWVAEALVIAARKNKRNLKYVEAILRRWKEEGHAKKQDRRDSQEDGRRYAEGEYSDFIEH